MTYGLIKLAQPQELYLFPTFFDKSRMLVSETINFDGLGTIEGYLMADGGILLGIGPVKDAAIEVSVDNEPGIRARVPTDNNGYFRVEIPGENLKIGIHSIFLKFAGTTGLDFRFGPTAYSTHITVSPQPADPLNPYSEPVAHLPDVIAGLWKKYQPTMIIGGIVIIGGYFVYKVYTTPEYLKLAKIAGKKAKEKAYEYGTKAEQYLKQQAVKAEKYLSPKAIEVSAVTGG